MPASATAAVTEPVKKDSVPEIIAASMVGTAIEFYDNYCYSIAAASYFGAIFFANVTNPALAQIYGVHHIRCLLPGSSVRLHAVRSLR